MLHYSMINYRACTLINKKYFQEVSKLLIKKNYFYIFNRTKLSKVYFIQYSIFLSGKIDQLCFHSSQ